MKLFLFIKSTFIQFLQGPKAIEVSLLALLLWWSFVLALPFHTFGLSPCYKVMEDIASEEVWSVIFFFVAMVNIYALAMNSLKMRVLGLLMSSGLWIFVSTMFVIGEIATTASGTYFIISCLNAYVLYKVGEQNGR